MAFKLKPPRLQVGDSWDDLTVIGYEGHYVPPDFSKSRGYHHYKVRCTCGNQFITQQHNLCGKAKRKRCAECARKSQVAKVQAQSEGSILYRQHGKGLRVTALRIDGREESLCYWSRVSGRDTREILKRLEDMPPKDAVFEGICNIRPHNAWPVPGRQA